jgi:hypothetical protein
LFFMKSKIIILIIFAGLLSACGSQPTPEAPASPPTEEVVSPTQTSVPTDTAVPPTEAPTTEPPTAEPAASAGVSFANDILPILQSRCVNCHGGERIEEGLIMKSYADIMAGSDNGPVVIPGDADNSLVVELLLANKMPKRGPKLTPPQVQLIVDWVGQGALNN